MKFRPESIGGVRRGDVDYRLQRRSVLSEFRKKRIDKQQVCDAHPELLRAGREIGEPTRVACPICAIDRAPVTESGVAPPARGAPPTDRTAAMTKAAHDLLPKLVLVTYVFGARLPSFGRCITKKTELVELSRRSDQLTAYVVEVCPLCGWNWLARSFAIGGTRRNVSAAIPPIA
jgi:hypothetical protein